MSKKNRMNDVLEESVYPEMWYPNHITDAAGTNYTTFAPIGSNHTLQALVSKKLHQLVIDDPTCRYTLSELGYFGFNSFKIVDNRLVLQIYFDPRLATYETMAGNGRKILKIQPEIIRLLNNRMIVVQPASPGSDSVNLEGIISVESMIYPKGKIVFDELGKSSLKMKGDIEDMKNQEVVVVNCNIRIALAFLLDIDLHDPNYNVQVCKATTANMKSGNPIMIDGASNVNPAWITVGWTDGMNGYRQSDAIPYLMEYAKTAATKSHPVRKVMEKTKGMDNHDDDTPKKEKKSKDHKSSKKRLS